MFPSSFPHLSEKPGEGNQSTTETSIHFKVSCIICLEYCNFSFQDGNKYACEYAAGSGARESLYYIFFWPQYNLHKSPKVNSLIK